MHMHIRSALRCAIVALVLTAHGTRHLLAQRPPEVPLSLATRAAWALPLAISLAPGWHDHSTLVSRDARTSMGTPHVRVGRPIPFRRNRDEMAAQGKDVQLLVEEIRKEYPSDLLQVTGFSSRSEVVQGGKTLAVRRAEAVREMLVSKGVRDCQITVVDAGQPGAKLPGEAVADSAQAIVSAQRGARVTTCIATQAHPPAR
jgi:hypothetical protein